MHTHAQVPVCHVMLLDIYVFQHVRYLNYQH